VIYKNGFVSLMYIIVGNSEKEMFGRITKRLQV